MPSLIDKKEQQGLLYGSLIAAGINAAMGRDTADALQRGLGGGAMGYAKGLNYLYDMKKSELDADREKALTALTGRRMDLDEAKLAMDKESFPLEQDYRKAQILHLLQPKPEEDKIQAVNPEHDVYYKGNLVKKGEPSKKDEGETTKSINSWAEAMYGKPWGQLQPQEKKVVLEKMRERIPMPIIVSTPFVDANSGVPLVMDRQGNMKTANLPEGVQPAVKPSAEMVKAESEITNMQSALGRIRNNYKSSFVGPLAGRYGSVKESTVGIPEDQATFYADVRSLKDALLRAKSGAQINEQEYRRMTKFLPDENAPAGVFNARMKRFEKELNSIIEGRRRGRTGQVSTPTATPSASAPTGIIRVRDKKSGKTGSLPSNEFDPALYERL